MSPWTVLLLVLVVTFYVAFGLLCVACEVFRLMRVYHLRDSREVEEFLPSWEAAIIILCWPLYVISYIAVWVIGLMLEVACRASRGLRATFRKWLRRRP
jgi:hypothetical protein